VQADTAPGRAAPGGASGRLALVFRLLLDALPSVTPRDAVARVLDCGGGSGTFAVPLARAGAQVTVVDISADALATLRRRADEAGAGSSVRGVAGEVEQLGELLGQERFDLVLAHGILGAVDDVPAAFRSIAAAVRPGGLLSLLTANPVAAVVAHALAGDLDLALVELRELAAARSAGAVGGASPAGLIELCASAGLVVEARRGVGVFADLVPGAALDTPAARETLAELDREAAALDPYVDLAGRMQLLARRPVP
jgi:S-adenosylmethionine-dependent methyltransferase